MNELDMNVGQPKPYTDENDNGAWNDGEPYTDVNENGTWDDDMGAAGLGGPGDVVSSVTNPDGTGPEVAWQRSGGGSLSASSQVGA